MSSISATYTNVRTILQLLTLSVLCLGVCACDNETADQLDKTVPQATSLPETPSASQSSDTKKAKNQIKTAMPDAQKVPEPELETVPAPPQSKIELELKESDISAPRLRLDLPEQHILQLQEISPPSNIRDEYPLTPLAVKKKPAGDKIKIRGNILTNPEAEELRDSVDGAELKLDLKWD